MRRIKLFEQFFIDNNNILIYHGTWDESDAQGIIYKGFDINIKRSGSAEGAGMGAFFSPEKTLYGKYIVEFSIPLSVFSESIVIYTGDETVTKEPMELAMRVNGRIETLEEQVMRINGQVNLPVNQCPSWKWGVIDDLGDIKGWVTDTRFSGNMSIHLRDVSIAKAVRYFSK